MMSERRCDDAPECATRAVTARAATMRDGKLSDDADDADDDVEEEYVVVDLPLELKALPGTR